MADGGTITAADTGSPADNSDSTIDPTTGQPQQGFKAWFKQHETLSLAIAAGVLLLTAILVFRSNKSSTPSGDLSGQATDTSGQTDNSGALAAAINALLNYLNSHSSDRAPPPPPAPGPPPPPKPPAPKPIPIGPPPGQRPPGQQPPIGYPPGQRPPPGPGPRPIPIAGQRSGTPGRPPPAPPGGRIKPGPTGPAQRYLPPRGGTGEGGTGDDSFPNDFPTVAQWTPDNANGQQSLSNITQGETSPVTRIESLFAGLFDGAIGPGGVAVPYPGPEPTGWPRSPWSPVPVGIPTSPIPIAGSLSPPNASPASGPVAGIPASGPTGPAQPYPGRGRFPRMPWQRV